ncbi:MAG: AMP-binding protein, partial [Dehalococcoidia bacterium]|nr:AMP-binding protein [Dehalococcoidia bacterium]
MVDQSSLENLLKVTDQYEPPQSLRDQANLQDYEGVYRRSIEDPERFWAEVASQLEWHRTWDKVFEWDYPNFKWFLGGQCNITVNCLDRHLGTARRNKAAFIWLGEDGTERVFTYARLAQMVNRFANGLKALGVKKGDRVVIYMPLSPEGCIAMLA